MLRQKRIMLKQLLALIGGSVGVKASAQQSSPAEDALLRQIAERSKTDPLIGAKIGSKEVTQRLLKAMKSERGVHIESLLCALGSLAGYSCQAAVRAQAQTRGMPESKALTRVETKDGQIYFFGDNLNKPLAESKYSVWGISAGGAQGAGCSKLLDIKEIFQHTSTAVGTPSFGVPRVPESHKPQDLPINYVRVLWPRLKPIIEKFCPDPEHWPVLLSLSVQEAIEMGKSVLDPCIALQIVMESAAPMSKVNLA